MVFGVIGQHSSSILLTIPFCLCNLYCCLFWSLLVSVDLRGFPRPGYYIRGRIHSSGVLYPQLVGLQAFLLLADGFSCRLLWVDILVDHSLLETTLSSYYGHSLAFFVSVACLRMRKVD